MGGGFEGSAKGFNNPTGIQVLADWLDESGQHPAADELRTGQTNPAELPRSGDGYGYGDGNGYGYGDGDGDGDGYGYGGL